MIDKSLLPPLKMGMRSSVNVSSEVLSGLLETPALHALLDSFSEAIILLDGDSRVRFLNLAAERVNRLSRQDVIGLPNAELFQRSALGFEDFQQAVGRGGNSALTRSRDGRMFLTSTQAKTMPPAIMAYSIGADIHWNVLGAAVVLITAPLILFVLLLQRQLISGLSQGVVRK